MDSTALVTGGYKGICEASTKNGTIKNEAVCPSELIIMLCLSAAGYVCVSGSCR